MLPSLNARLRKAAPSITISAPVLGLFVVVLLALGIFTAWQLRPFVLWGYNLQRATAAQSVAFTYPDPRQSDSLPTVTNAEANQSALGHLAAAIHWRPNDPYAYRLAGESYLAAGDLLNAVNIMEIGLREAGNDILLGWQLGLAYDQLYAETVTTPGENLVPLFAETAPDVPDLQITTPYCQIGDADSCYIGEATFTQPYAAYPEAGTVTADTLFLHPPARVTIPLDVPTGDPALTFLLGLDPQAKTWGTDGATFQLWIVEPNGGILPVYERTVIGGELTQGWVPDSIDLSPWAGQSIQLAVGTTAGPLNDNRGDWIGFGNISLTNRTIASYRSLMPEGKFRNAMLEGPILGTQLVERGDEALYAGRFDEAARWYRRAEWAGVDVSSTIAYAQFSEILAREGWDAAFPYLETAIKSDSGWGSTVNRFYAFFNYGRWLTQEEQYGSSEGYLLVALAIYPDPDGTLYGPISEVHRFLAIGYDAQRRYEEGLEHARIAVTLTPNNFLTQYQYGYALFHQDPTQLPEVEQAFARALEVNASANNWQTILLVWLEKGDNERTRTYCETALKTYTPEQLGYTCWEGSGSASSILYRDYQAALAAGDEESAYQHLEAATQSDGGWSNAPERFNAWNAWTSYLYEEERYAEVIVAGQTTLRYLPEYVSIDAITRLNRMVATSMAAEGQYEEALAFFQDALAENESPFLYFDYGKTLYEVNPDDLGAVRAAFESAINVSIEPSEMRSRVIDYWYENEQAAEAALLCATPDLTEMEVALCVAEGDEASSGAAYHDYLTAIETEDSDTEGAIPFLEAAIALDSGWQRLGYRHDAWLAWGEYLWNQERYEEAHVALETSYNALDVAVSDSSLSRVARAIGLVYLSEENYDAAIDAFEQAIDLNEDNIFAYAHLARSIYLQNPDNIAAARSVLTEAIEIDPENVDLWRTILSFWAFVNQPEEIDRFCGLASESVLDEVGNLCWYGTQVSSSESYFEYSSLLASDATAAFEALERAITTDRGWADETQRFKAWYNWGARLLQTQEFEGAVAAFEKSVAVAPDTLTARELSEAYRQWAIAFSRLTQFDEALVQADAAIMADPTYAMAHVLRGDLLYRGDATRIDESEAAFAEAMRLAPSDGFVWSAIAVFWLEQGQDALSLQLCEDLPEGLREPMALYCWTEGEISGTSYYNIYRTEQEAGDEEAAFAALESATTTDGGWINQTTRYLAWRAWGGKLWQARRYEEAVPALNTAIEVAPSSIASNLIADDYFVLGLSYASLRQVPQALEAFTQSVDLNPNNPWARMNYGYALYNSDPSNKAFAVEQFTAALTIAPEELRIWQEVIGFWQRNGENAEVEAVCASAATSSFATDLQSLCTTP